MFRFTLILLFSMLTFHNVMAYDNPDNKRKYHIALHVTNPLSAFYKYGGEFEQRTGRISYIQTYTKYIGAFPGKQYGFEIHKFFKTKKAHEYYMYFKTVLGETSFESKKLAIYGEKTDINLGPEAYIGGAIGFGRRYNFNVFFMRWNIGIKACPLVDPYDFEPAQNMFRLFYVTGPGAAIELNFHCGIQL